jgi:light-regulated signal transduction histidine kinase (bacteriophytochrome)
MKNVLDGLSMSINENNARIDVGKLPLIQIDEGQMSIVFHNLLTNALKFRGDADPVIQISAEESEENWIISVQDNGIGISKEYADRVFEIFQRLHSRKEYPGTGIGLALVKKIIERHHGRIWFKSELGNGTTFYIEIPKHINKDS